MPGRLRSPSPSTVDNIRLDRDQITSTIVVGTTPPQIYQTPSEQPGTVTHGIPTLARAQNIRVRNRRLRYIQHHDSSYFSSPDLELADPLLYDRLIRQFLTPAEREAQGRERGWSGVLEADLTRAEAKVAAIADSEADTEARAENGRGEQVETKEEGEELWRKVMTLRFIEGKDIDVDYAEIDGNEEWDDIETEKREEEEKYFDAETPSSVTGAEDTGIQDY